MALFSKPAWSTRVGNPLLALLIRRGGFSVRRSDRRCSDPSRVQVGRYELDNLDTPAAVVAVRSIDAIGVPPELRPCQYRVNLFEVAIGSGERHSYRAQVLYTFADGGFNHCVEQFA